MGLEDKFLGKIVFLDTAPLIYFIEGHSEYQNILLNLFKANDQGKILFQTSTLTLLEVLVRPMKLKRFDLVDKYEEILTTSTHIDVFDMDLRIARTASELRANYNLKTPDSIQLSTAINRRANYFFTNDSELKKVQEIKVITLNK